MLQPFIGGVIDKGEEVVIGGRDFLRQFNLQQENVNGFFTNMTLLSMLLGTLLGKGKPFHGKKSFKKEYDYIVVGGGSAGATLAARLSEMPCVTVLLLEAGGQQPWISTIPGYQRLFLGTDIDWLYETVPQKNAAFAQKGNRVIWNSGRALGGGSALNAMLYVRGNKHNYDAWEKAGANGWGWKDVFPYFQKLEDNKNKDQLDQGYHSQGGPMTAEMPNYSAEMKPYVRAALTDMGFDVKDINGRSPSGLWDLQGTVRNQQRCSTFRAYLEPAKDRKNLDIGTYCFATKILIDDNKVAYGVEFEYGGKTYTVRARREVIISVGGVRTPQLLMLSGIGPEEELNKHNIRVIVNLPGVGKNLQDHCATTMPFDIECRKEPFSKEPVSIQPFSIQPFSIQPFTIQPFTIHPVSIQPFSTKLANPRNILEYVIKRSGPLASITAINWLLFANGSNSTQEPCDCPRIEIYIAEYSVLDAKYTLNLRDEVYDQVFKPHIGNTTYICFPSTLQPHSRGTITLKSANPRDIPNIDPNYYGDERDLEDMIVGMKICDQLAKHPEMQKLKATFFDRQASNFPGCEDYKGDDYWGCLAKSITNTFWHPSGTAKMGSPDDPEAVVDPQLRVIGVKNLRVVNAAIFPTIPAANTNIPTIMVAEKASDMIKETIKCEEKPKEGKTRKIWPFG